MKKTSGTSKSSKGTTAGRDREYVRELKAEDPFPGLRVRVSDQEEYKIRTLARGEQAFYQENDRALLLEIIAGQGIIFKKSIRRWDDGARVSDSERERIIERMTKYMTSRGDPASVVVVE